jgi:hypothetical protein
LDPATSPLVAGLRKGVLALCIGSILLLGGCAGREEVVPSTPDTSTPVPSLKAPHASETRDFRDPKTDVQIKLRSFRAIETKRYVNNFPPGWYLLAFYVTVTDYGSTAQSYNTFDLSCIDQSGKTHGTDVVLPVPYDTAAYGNGLVYPNKSVGGWAGCMYRPNGSVRITWGDNSMISPTTIVRVIT